MSCLSQDPPTPITAVVLTGLLPRVSVHVLVCFPSSTTYSHSFVVLRSAAELEMSGSWGIPGPPFHSNIDFSFIYDSKLGAS